MRDRDRYLKQRAGRFYYVRRVPTKLRHLDQRGTIEEALGTDSRDLARPIRDALVEADEAYWRSLLEGRRADDLVLRHEAARARAKALGLSYRSLDDLVANAPVEELTARLSLLEGKSGAERRRTADAALGGAPAPAMKLSAALDEFLQKIAPEELAGKSPKQVKDYKKVKKRAVNNFIALRGDKDIWSIDRADAVAFHDWWLTRITGDGARRMSGNSGNRDIGNLRRIWRMLAEREQRAGDNPFDGLRFKDPKRLRATPLPFSAKWIREKLLRAAAYARTEEHPRKLNRQAAAIFLVVLETGCRPSEICNLTPERIRLDDDVPHLVVDFDPQREIKTESSIRLVPLVGVALAVMKRFPKGFDRYLDKETNFSVVMMKHLRRRGLLPSERHVVYSARHAFEDRLKEAGVGDEMRRSLMGHSIDRPEYGSGGSLEFRQEQLKKIELPWDPALLAYFDD